MRVVVTGAHGFLGWHLRVRLAALSHADVVPVGREHFTSPEALAAAVAGADVVVHAAGANRGNAAEVAATNVDLAQRLASALRSTGAAPVVVFANSTQADAGTAYGVSKARAAEMLEGWAQQAGAPFVDVVLPNLFGEHGRPYYNSVVATFCHELAHGGEPEVRDSAAEIELLHAQDAARALIGAFDGVGSRLRPTGVEHTVGGVLQTLHRMHRTYRGVDLPELADAFERSLFNTYRSFVFPQRSPTVLSPRSDQRGSLVEAVRSRSGQGQVFTSTTLPGHVRGDHYHLRKFERFAVLSGSAEIRLRRVMHDDVLRIRLDGSEQAFVDMPAMWAHAIENVGDRELVTLFWADELFDASDPDTFAEVVSTPVEATA